MKRSPSRFLSDYGMILVLLLLCAFFSAVTYREQSPSGAAAGRQLANAITGEFGKTPGVLIVVRDLPDDAAMADQLQHDLAASGARVVDVVRGDPKDARAALQELVASGGKLDVVAGTQTTGEWHVFEDLKADFPSLGEP